jgi:hypothetical protein
VVCLLCTHDTKGATCFLEYGAKMDGLGEVSNLLGGKSPMQFASFIFMSGWRALHHATVPIGDALCICMRKYMSDLAHP